MSGVFDSIRPTSRAARIQNANLSGVSIRDCNIAGLRVEGYLVSDLIAAYRKSV